MGTTYPLASRLCFFLGSEELAAERQGLGRVCVDGRQADGQYKDKLTDVVASCCTAVVGRRIRDLPLANKLGTDVDTVHIHGADKAALLVGAVKGC